MLAAPPFAAIVLAAQRAGTVDPLAAEFGLSHKCVVPIGDVPLIVHAVRALRKTPGLARLRIVIEPEMAATVAALLGYHPVATDFVAAADNLTDSVHAAAHDLDEPTIVTTADNVLLTPGAVERVLNAIAGGADVVVAMARREAVLAAHPAGQRRFYRFRDDEYSNCNLYGFWGKRAFAAAESFRSGGQFAKKPMRLLGAVGVWNVLLMLLRQLSLGTAMKRLSRRFGLTITAVVLRDGAHAIDVDNRRTYDCAALLLERRGAAPPNGVPADEARAAA